MSIIFILNHIIIIPHKKTKTMTPSLYPIAKLYNVAMIFASLHASDASGFRHDRHAKNNGRGDDHFRIDALSPHDFEVSRNRLEEKYPVFQSFDGEMHAGLLPAAIVDKTKKDGKDNNDYSSYFFWLFQPNADSLSKGRDNEENLTDESFRDDTLVIWLNGGPGCSSLFGLIVENGPITLPAFQAGIPHNENPNTHTGAQFQENPFAWTKKSAMLFIEQPGGVGFSSASSQWKGSEADNRTEKDVSHDFYAFLQNFYLVFGEDMRQKKLYIAGESYAGMYIPSIARWIHLENQKVAAVVRSEKISNSLVINLEGIAIGNGWIDVNIQAPTTIDYAFWHSMIDFRTYQSLHQKWNECIQQKITDSFESPFHPFTTPDECGITLAVMEASGSGQMYDVTTYDTYPGYDDPEGAISTFFNDPDVRIALNAPSTDNMPLWEACVPGSGRRRLDESLRSSHPKTTANRQLLLLDKDRNSVVPYIAELLDDAKIRVLLYNGDRDLACNPQSTEMALNSMSWAGNDKWMDPNVTQWMEWKVDNEIAGHTKNYGNLTFVVVYNSGHFVPVNQARNSLNLIGRLLDKKTFGDVDLPQFPGQGGLDSTEIPVVAVGAFNLSIKSVLVGFLFGSLISFLATSRIILRKRKKKNVSESPMFYDDYPKTEFTPLNGNGSRPPTVF